MATKTDSLAELFVDLTGEDTIVERQEEAPSHEPIDERQAAVEEAVSLSVRNDGLDEALDSGFGESSTAIG